MRPKSIVIFDRLFLTALVLSLINGLLSYSAIGQRFQTDPALAPMQSFAGPFLIVSMLFGFGISLLLWYFISRRASDVAKWILVAFTAFGILGLVQNLRQPMLGTTVLAATFALTALQVAAAFFLFRPDARAWFAGTAPVDPDVFN